MAEPTVAGGTALPRLGVLYHPRTVELFPLVRAASGSWRTVWLVDRTRLVPGVRLAALARFGEVIDITDRDPERIAAQSPGPIQAILSASDADLLLGAELAPVLGARFYDPELAFRLNDKPAQRAAFRAAGLPTPDFVALRAGTGREAALRAAARLQLPAVLKPAKGAGSRATHEVLDSAALASYLAELGDPLSEDFVLEQRLPDGSPPIPGPWADHVSVESFAVDGRLHHIGVTGRFRLLPPFRETGNIFPAAVPAQLWPQLSELAEAALLSLGVTDGCFHTEIKFTPAGPRLLEVNGRLGGGSIPWAIERVTGRSMIELAGRAMLGLPLGLPASQAGRPPALTGTGVGFGRYFEPPLNASHLVGIDGLTEARALEGIEELITFHEPGDRVDASIGFYAHVAAARGWVPDHRRLAVLTAELERSLQLSYDQSER